MIERERRLVSAPCLQAVVLAAALVTGISRSHAVMDATTECLVEFADVPAAEKNGGIIQCTDCDPTCDFDGAGTANGSCTFKLKACVNQADATCAATELKTIRVKGKCGASALKFTPTGSAPACGTEGKLAVKLKKRGKKPGKCKVTAKALSSGRPRRTDKDTLTLICNPRPAGQACPTSITTTTVTICATTTTSPTPSLCAPIVPGQPIANSYKLQGTTGEKRCTTESAANRFGVCTSDADCGNTSGSCLQLPWVTADAQVMPFPTAVHTIFTVSAEGSFPACEHPACVPCGNPNASCPGIPACEVSGNPNSCVPRGTRGCCDQPGFVVPTFFINLLGGLCSRVDQIGCGNGVVNTSNPQTGDNEVTKEADTSDPGNDCCYNGQPGSQCIGGVNLNDDPAPAACTVQGAGNDSRGKIVRTIGNGAADANGIQFRLTTPELSTTWQDGQSPSGTCAEGSTFDDQELLISQIVIKAEPTTAGASGSFTDMNGDGCKRAGSGFTTNADPITDGPIVVPGAPAGPARPQSYDGTVGSVTAAVSEVFSGANSPIKDLGFVAITPNMPAVVVPPVCCSCVETPGCPE